MFLTAICARFKATGTGTGEACRTLAVARKLSHTWQLLPHNLPSLSHYIITVDHLQSSLATDFHSRVAGYKPLATHVATWATERRTEVGAFAVKRVAAAAHLPTVLGLVILSHHIESV